MTSRSPKSRRTTAWRAIRRATATSLLAAFGWATPAAAQSAPTNWAASGDKPARGSWQPYPTHQLGTAVPLASAAVPSQPTAQPAAPPQPAAIGSRVVVFTKPAGEVQPVQAQQPQPGRVDAPAPADQATPIQQPTAREPDRSRVFTVPTDDELIAEMIDRVRKNEDRKYQEDLEKWTKNPERRDEDKPRPPAPVKAEDYRLSVSLQGTTIVPAAVTKPGYPAAQARLEPGYVVHRRLFFEEKNSERYGWELGMAQPFVSAAYFYKDVLLWPAHLTSNFHERFDTNAGKCLPGTPVAYYLYPPQLTITGLGWETGAVLGVAFLLP